MDLSVPCGVMQAAIVSPVDGIGYQDELIKVPVGEDGGKSLPFFFPVSRKKTRALTPYFVRVTVGEIARVMLREIVGRQTGEIPSEWSFPVNA